LRRQKFREEDIMTSSYDEVYGSWRRDPEGFWMDQATAIDWFTKPKTAFDPDQGVYGLWFPMA
jgi:propionyl-CoA synthetase